MAQLLAAINNLRSEVKVANEGFGKQLEECNSEIKDLKEHLNKYSDDIVKNTERIETLSAKINSFSGTYNELSEKCLALERRVVELEGTLVDNEQTSLVNCVEVGGVPATDNENVMDIVQTIGRALKVDLSPGMINNCFRRRAPPQFIDGWIAFHLLRSKN